MFRYQDKSSTSRRKSSVGFCPGKAAFLRLSMAQQTGGELLPARLFFLCVLLVSCSRQPVLSTPLLSATSATIAQPTQTPPKFTPIANTEGPLPRLTESQLLNTPERIVTGGAANIGWSTDSQTLFYTTISGTERHYWAYNIKQGSSTEFVESDFIRLTSHLDLYQSTFQTPHPPSPTELPTQATSIYMSPSGERILYLIILEPTRIPSGGEDLGGGQPSELWLWEGGISQKIGLLPNCVEGYLWTNDERKAIALPIGPVNCSPVALIDLQNKSIEDLASRDIDYIIGLSPNNKKLLYGTMGGPLSVMDMDNLVVDKIDITSVYTGQWINDDNLLIAYTSEKAGSRDWLVGTYDLKTSEVIQIIDPELTPEVKGLVIRKIFLSPDDRWLAFYATNKDNGAPDGLWLMQLNLTR